jgi:hypothetical protein
LGIINAHKNGSSSKLKVKGRLVQEKIRLKNKGQKRKGKRFKAHKISSMMS